MAPVKRKLTNKSLAEKCKTLKDLKNGLSNKDVATKYGVPRNLVSTWVRFGRFYIELTKNITYFLDPLAVRVFESQLHWLTTYDIKFVFANIKRYFL